MKKPQIFLAAACFIAAASLTAQPTLNAGNTNPVAGDVFAVSNTNYVSPGSAGANQTWNLSTMTASATSNYSIVNASSTPSASSFSNANIAGIDAGNYRYWKTTASELENHGTIGGGATISYTNVEKILQYPFTFNNSFADTWGGTFSSNGMTFYRTGTTTVTADGHGTVTTPAGTFNNVLRIHMVQVYTDSANLGGPIIINTSNDQYFWYLPGNHHPVASVYSLTTMGSSSTSGFYLNSVITGLNEQSSVNGVHIFPNPASDKLLFSGFTAGTTVRLFDLTGKQTMTVSFPAASADLSKLPAGVYIAITEQNGVRIKTEKIVISR